MLAGLSIRVAAVPVAAVQVAQQHQQVVTIVQEVQPWASSSGRSARESTPLFGELTQRHATCPSYSCLMTTVPGRPINVPAMPSVLP